jgi:hypothetical protein
MRSIRALTDRTVYRVVRAPRRTRSIRPARAQLRTVRGVTFSSPATSTGVSSCSGWGVVRLIREASGTISTVVAVTAVSPQETSRFYAGHFSRWSRWRLEDVEPAVNAYLAYSGSLECLRELGGGPPADKYEILRHAARIQRVLDTRTKAGDALDSIVGAGLAAREGTLLLPPALIPKAFRWAGMTADEAQVAFTDRADDFVDRAGDWLAWRLLELCVASLTGKLLGPIRVCACTAVFRPRRSDAQSCDLCRHKPAAPILGVVGPVKPGEKTKVRVPSTSGNVIVAWHTGTVGISKESGDVFASSRTNIQGTPRDRKRRARRV